MTMGTVISAPAYGFTCVAYDITNGTAAVPTTINSTTSCAVKFATAATSDVITIFAIGL
jgi:hypothetical protein